MEGAHALRRKALCHPCKEALELNSNIDFTHHHCTRTALAKCPSENWPSWLKKMAVIRALSLELSRMRPLTFGNVARIAGA
jgi:hypothetical protein